MPILKKLTRKEKFRNFLKDCILEFKSQYTERELTIFYLHYHERMGRRKISKLGFTQYEITKLYKKIKEPAGVIQQVQSEFMVE